MYRIAICDDDRAFASRLHQTIEELLTAQGIQARIEEFYDSSSLLCRLNQEEACDLVFLDILLGGDNGYLFAKRLRRERLSLDIVFITTTTEYAVAGYDASPLLYLVKPVSSDQIEYALHIFLEKRRPRQILLKLPGQVLSIPVSDILYCEVYGHTTSLHLSSGKIMELRYSLNKLEDQLPPALFVRSHQSYLVNMEHIDAIARYQLTLSSGQTLPISQSKYLSLQNSFLNYASRQKLHL